MIACRSCQRPLAEGSVFCSWCGAPQAGAAAPPRLFERPGLVTVLAVLDFVGGFLWLLVAGAVLAAGFGDRKPVAVGVGFVFLLVAALGFACGYGMLRLRRFGRVLQIAFAIVGLLGFPLGTIVSILILAYMFQPGIRVLFSEKRPETLAPQELSAVAALARSGASAGVVAAVAAAVLLVGVAITGIIAAIAIPNLLNAVERAKQKRTIADMRTMSAAIESYAVDYNRYPRASSLEELAKTLEPRYVAGLPRQDAWARDFRYQAWPPDSPRSFAIASAGRDGSWEHEDLRQYAEGATTSFNSDIVFANGKFVQYPEGFQPTP